MNLSLYIAKRYLFSKKSHNAINIISGISACGVAFATLALVCTLSVFNGFQELVAGLFTAFDPELKITATQGKRFDSQDSLILQIRNIPEVEVSTLSIEENALIQYKGRQAVVTIKGIEDKLSDLKCGLYVATFFNAALIAWCINLQTDISKLKKEHKQQMMILQSLQSTSKPSFSIDSDTLSLLSVDNHNLSE